jgi:hypothetical protein
VCKRPDGPVQEVQAPPVIDGAGSEWDPNTIVIGQTLGRVQNYAAENELSIYYNTADFGGDQRPQLEADAQFFRAAFDRGLNIVSIGPDPDAEDRDLGWWFILEGVLAADADTAFRKSTLQQ